jgi:hypothetical protein
MKVEIYKSIREGQLETEIKRLEKKYGSFDNLRQKYSVIKCRRPEYADDYMIWKTIRSEDVRIQERVTLKTFDIYRVITPKRMELLDYLQTHRPESIKILAQELRRNYKNTYDDVKALETYGLVELLHEGKNKKPVTFIDKIDISPTKRISPK